MPDEVDDSVSVMHKAFCSSGGSFSDVVSYMKDHDPEAPRWMIESIANVSMDAIIVRYIVHFSHDGRTVIYSSGSSGMRAGDQRAVRVLSSWLIDHGWKRPEPSPSEADAARDFWKELWTTGVVDSKYLQAKYGKRRIFDEE
jgi:hypothetical protein